MKFWEKIFGSHHSKLMKMDGLYSKWHNWPYHKYIHYSVLLVYLAVIVKIFLIVGVSYEVAKPFTTKATSLQVIVSGAGTALDNGIYTESGTYDGKPTYVNPDGRWIYYLTALHSWYVAASVGGYPYDYVGANTDLPANPWNIESGIGSLPAPAVTADTWSVCGSGDVSYNGVYIESGTYGGRPVYTNGVNYLFSPAGNYWSLGSDYNSPNWAYQSVDGALPSTWITEPLGTAPPPTMVIGDTCPGGGVPAAPTIGTPTVPTTNMVQWNFTESDTSNVTGYKVYDGSNNLVASCGSPTATSCDETGLLTNVQYAGRYVVAYNDSGESPHSGTAASIYTLANPPNNLAVVSRTTAIINWSWGTNSNPGGTKFYASDATGNSGWVADATSWSAVGTNPNTQYTLSVEAENGDDVATSPVTLNAYSAIEAPASLTTSNITNHSIDVTVGGTLSNLGLGSSGIQYCNTTTSVCSPWQQSAAAYTFSSLDPNKQYTFTVQARNGDGITTSTASTSAYTLANPPNNLAVSSRTTTGINWSWGVNNNPGITQYYASDSAGNSGWTTSTTWNQSGLSPNTKYTLSVKARNHDNVETSAVTFDAYSAIETPTGLNTSNITLNSITVTATGSFSNLSIGSSGIQYCDTTTSTCSSWQPTAGSYTFTGLNTNVNNTFTVQSRNGDGVVAGTATVSKYTLIETPTGMTFSNVTTRYITVTAIGSFSHLTSGRSGIQYCNTNTGYCSPWQQSTASYTSDELGINFQVTFTVQARNGDGITTPVATAAKYTLANPPANLSVADRTTSCITWNWHTNSNSKLSDTFNPAGTEYYASDSVGNYGWSAANTWDQCGLQTNTQYTVSVKARNGENIETASVGLAAYTAIESPAGLTSSNITSNSITVSVKGSFTNLGEGSSGIIYCNSTKGSCSSWERGTGSYTFTGLAAGTTYNFSVQSRNGDAISGGTAKASATTLDNSPTPTPTPTPIRGCTDKNAINYNSKATVDDGSCQNRSPDLIISGCTNSLSINYNPLATVDNGTCIICNDVACPVVRGCTDYKASNYNSKATIDDGSCQYPAQPIFGCTNFRATNYNSKANFDDGSCKYPPDSISGCTNYHAINYNPLATVDNGSCKYPPGPIYGCTDFKASNYNPDATKDDGSCKYPTPPPVVSGCTNSKATNYNSKATVDDGSCVFPLVPIFGCTDSQATNYNSKANFDDGSCKYPPGSIFGCTNSKATNYNALATIDDDSCQLPYPPGTIPGCTNSKATNYNSHATIDDGSCKFSPPKPPIIAGCTNSKATNYNSKANWDDGSCQLPYPPGTIPGCTNSKATNYNSQANFDNGSCEFSPPPCVGKDCKCTTSSCNCTGSDCNCTDPTKCKICTGSSCTPCTGDSCKPCTGSLCSIKKLVNAGMNNPMISDLAAAFKKLVNAGMNNPVISDLAAALLALPVLLSGIATILPVLANSLLPITSLLSMGTVVGGAGLFGLPALAVVGKKKGYIYEVIEKTPISGVLIRVFDLNGNRLIYQTFTNQQGEFLLNLPAGRFYLEVKKEGYQNVKFIEHTASQTADFNLTDGYYNNIYFPEQVLEISQQKTKIIENLSVPLQKIGQQKAVGFSGKSFGIKILSVLKAIALPLLIIGTVLTTYTVIINPNSIINLILAGYYILLWIWQIYVVGIKVKGPGTVLDENDQPLSLVLVRAINEKGKLIMTTVSDQQGKFILGISRGNYALTFKKPGFEEKVINVEIKSLADLRKLNIKLASKEE